ncbi:DUF4245 domain-containing protein [Streptacidiphilus sp. PB12-B1b]|uniref:DUF4245 domain-containing protein n=1 Tax=Streptacidiphilus sp. PB12-B1b TaxID=2705012 RepID=UPI0015F8D718|nr:DUF4245 domain-containing protein [Streptacidiphilus sp. PB12-B1b]QMU75152.1 DUF4245 domain-containing protein [Streptacidiphilus sp. PB12-B1b]
MATQNAAAQAGTAPTTTQKRPGMGAKSVRDMVLSLAAVMLAGLVIYYFIPHSGGNGVHAVEGGIGSSVASARRVAPYPVLAPVGLPKGWTATAVDYNGTDPHAAVWTLGYIDPSRQYVSVQQSNGGASDFIAGVTTGGVKVAGVSTIDGVTWSHYQGSDYRALVLQTPKVTTVVTGTESFAAMDAFAATLRSS